jgi:hypothetical protein
MAGWDWVGYAFILFASILTHGLFVSNSMTGNLKDGIREIRNRILENPFVVLFLP